MDKENVACNFFLILAAQQQNIFKLHGPLARFAMGLRWVRLRCFECPFGMLVSAQLADDQKAKENKTNAPIKIRSKSLL